MTNSTNSSHYDWKYEYYYDYVDPIIVDQKKLKLNKYSIVIIFWTGMAAFVVLLFLVLMHLSRSGSQAPVWVPVHKSRAARRNIERSPEGVIF